MITLTAKISIFTGDNGVIENVTCNTAGNNISSEISAVIGRSDIVGSNPFLFGVSKLGDGSTFTADKVNYFIGSKLSNEYGEFAEPYVLTLMGSNIKAVTIVFDTFNGRHPNKIIIDGKEFTDDDPIFSVADQVNLDFWNDNETTHTIEISSWNTPNYPVVIQGIYITPTSLEINRRNIISIDRSIIDRSDLKLPSWGIISNGGSIEFNDANGEVRDYAEQGFLQEGQKVEIFLNDTLSKLTQKIGEYYTSEWDYDNNNRVVRVSVQDRLMQWQERNTNASPYDPNKPISKNMLSIYTDLALESSGSNLLTIKEIDETTKTVLENIYVQYPTREAGTLWSQWQKFCTACQCYMYVNNNGKVVIRHNSGS